MPYLFWAERIKNPDVIKHVRLISCCAFSLCKECGNCTLIEIIRTVEAHSITGLVSGEKRRIERSRIPTYAMRLYPRRWLMVMDVRVNVIDLWLLQHWHRRGQIVSEICLLVGCDGMVRNIQPVSRYFLQLCVLGVCFLWVTL